ncbi:MAG: flagellar hook-associated protein FlgK [candidate division Zixibacteria bacterium]|nr:flagellar hook-associated protein FlgK [candidate division Zixibacteria bacterium]
MAGLFQGLELGKRALISHQYELTTAGHNMANVNTPGYSRQRAVLAATDPMISTVGRFGSGVRIASVNQARDMFLTAQYRQGNDQLNRWGARQKAMNEVENIFQEPSSSGFSKTLDSFFSAWQTLSQNPESSAGRAAVREQASLVVNAFHQMSNSLSDLQKSLDDQVGGMVTKINGLAANIAEINRQVARAELGGEKANDLRDRRDQAIDELSQYADVHVIEMNNGVARVFIGSMELVEQNSSNRLATMITGNGDQTQTTVVWQGGTSPVTVAGGELAGLIESRDQLLPQYRAQLDELAAGIVQEVNTLHRTGYGIDGATGRDFFTATGITADTISVSADVTNDLNKIGASLSGGPGDNAVALSIANLQKTLTMDSASSTFNDFYGKIVGAVGVRSSEANDAKTNADLVLQQIEFSRQSIQGVSLDEEMANLIAAQHAYDAAARIISTMDSAINTVINDMGVGR